MMPKHHNDLCTVSYSHTMHKFGGCGVSSQQRSSTFLGSLPEEHRNALKLPQIVMLSKSSSRFLRNFDEIRLLLCFCHRNRCRTEQGLTFEGCFILILPCRFCVQAREIHLFCLGTSACRQPRAH